MQTERLLLRPLTRDDLDACAAYTSLEATTTYLRWEPRSRAETAMWLERAVTGAGDNLAVIRTDTGEFIGDVGLWPGEHNSAEVGYVLHPDHYGNGFATEAVRELILFGFADRGYHRILARLDARNHRSRRLVERLGMRREAHFLRNEFVKGEWTDEYVYATLAEEWVPAGSSPSARSRHG